MIRGLYSAGAALETATANQEVSAENLAHATTPGYRRQGLSFDATQQSVGSAAAGTGAANGNSFTFFTPGPIQQTNNPLDLAISGDAFFVLEGARGPVYTRNGSFEMNAHGELQTKSGLKVQGQGGRITIPPGASEIRINVDGTILADGANVGRLDLARFDDRNQLRRAGPTLFEGPAPKQPELGSYRIEQGYREGSNVQVVDEMVSMMLGMRQYEAAERAMRSLADAVGLNTKPQG
jgi:flagellar basal-body rod protein FlgF